VDSSPEHVQKLRKTLMGLLSRREHSQSELLQKLQIRGYAPELTLEHIKEFEKNAWQSDQRYAEMLIRSRITKKHGPVKIRKELKYKGVADHIINTAFTQLQDDAVDWVKLCQSAWDKKYSTKAESNLERSKQIKFLQQRGFTHEQIKIVLS